MNTVHKITVNNPPQLPCSIFIQTRGWVWFEICAITAEGYLKLGYTHWSKSRTPRKPRQPREGKHQAF
jgi:hypothetical protein